MTEEKSPQAPKPLGSDLDKKQLLLLGLNLLNKGLKLPYAEVRPQSKPPAPKPASVLAEKLKSSVVSPPPTPPATETLLEGSRKRKRDPGDDFSEVERREKRYITFYLVESRRMHYLYYNGLNE